MLEAFGRVGGLREECRRVSIVFPCPTEPILLSYEVCNAFGGGGGGGLCTFVGGVVLLRLGRRVKRD